MPQCETVRLAAVTGRHIIVDRDSVELQASEWPIPWRNDLRGVEAISLVAQTNGKTQIRENVAKVCKVI